MRMVLLSPEPRETTSTILLIGYKVLVIRRTLESTVHLDISCCDSSCVIVRAFLLHASWLRYILVVPSLSMSRAFKFLV